MVERLRHLPPSLVAKIVACVVVIGSLTAGAFAAHTPTSSTQPAGSTTVRPADPSSPGVSATGSLAAVTEQNLGFAKGGQLTSVQVKVGDHVETGQVLATIDDVPARQALAAARAQLRGAQAGLDRATDSPAVDDAENTLDQAKDVLDAVRRQAEALDAADAAAIANAQQQYNANPTQANASALSSAQQKQSVDRANSQVAIETAEQSVVTARNARDSADADQPHSIDQQAALVAAARATVAQAQRDVDNTTLRAPVAGTVTVLNGAVGEYVGPSTGTSALAPGTDAAIPGSSGSTSTGSSAAGASPGAAAAPPRPGGTQFLVLSDVDQFQVVAPFNEADVASIEPGQDVDITFDAIPGLTVPGRVTSVAPAATAISGVISYYVTVALDNDDPRLKGGQTANVTVHTGGAGGQSEAGEQQ